MDPVVWVVVVGVIAVATVIATAFLVSSSSRKSEQQLAAMRQEVQSSLTTQSQGLSSQLNHVVQNVTQQLGQVRQELQAGVASSGQLASQAQRDVSKQLESATEAVRQISQQLGAVQRAGDDLTKASSMLQQVLGGAKSRGALGEMGLARMLEDSLPRKSYEIQYRFSTGDIVDAVVRAGDRLIPIDSKFPLDSYRRMAEDPDARKEFGQAVRKHADSIASKYILQDEGTLDLALMFVPSEAIYYELLMTEDARNGKLDAYCRGKFVVPVSPNTLYAYLSSILMGLRGLQIEENARRLLGSLAGLNRQLETFSDTFEKVGTHLRHAQQSYEDADSRLDRTRNSLQQMSQGLLPEAPAAKVLEPAPDEPRQTEPLFAAENYKAD
ncbi:MAG TPA: DNA recombination protein RmuC [Candidatus Limnocylindrales bacterium]|nr:DNA recombination protein RmuC [Candidatus Limnocylindrales bacterium]